MDTVKYSLKRLLLIAFCFFTIFSYTKVKADSNVTLTFTENSIEETVSGSGYVIDGTTVEIIRSGTYTFMGNCSEGHIEIKKELTGVNLIFRNLNLESSNTAPLIIKKDGASVNIETIGNNTLTDNENPEQEFDPNPDIADMYEGAAIKIKSGSTLSIGGSGTLNLVSTNNGIKGSSEANFIFNAGVLNIDAANNGISCDGTITINNGIIDIEAYNEGIKLEPNIDDFTSLAKLTINGGRIDIDAGEDGIQAIGDIDINGWNLIHINSIEDGIQTRSNFTMTNGDITIHTYEGFNPSTYDKDGMSAKGIKASKTDEEEEFATNTINITGGTINIDSSDDSIHSDGYLNITRGTINVKSGDDGIHADTKLVIGTQNGLERDPEINVNESIEGIESGNVYVYSGKISVKALDDGMNAGGGASSGGGHEHGKHYNPETGQMEDNYALFIYGGKILINCEGDGLDANGSIYLYGGSQVVYHQDAQGNNSALDRDHRLVIDGATIFSAGGVADNGLVDDIGSNQKIVINDTGDYSANALVAVKDGENVVFNDQIPKRSTYTFYSSPSLTDNGSIQTVSELIDDYRPSWRHTFDDGVITTPATESTPGIITYTCDEHTTIERKTYFYRDQIEFSFVNKTLGEATVTIGSESSSSDFNTTDIDEYIFINTSEDIELVKTYDGVNFNSIHGEPTIDPNVYRYHVDPSASQTFYVVIDGDINMDGHTELVDASLIGRSLVSTSNPDYYELSSLQKVLADTNENGLINSHDGLSIISDLQGDDIYDESYFGITSIEPVILDGEHDGEATISFLTKKDIFIDAMDGIYFPSEENPSTNRYLELTDIQGQMSAQQSYIDVKNGFAGAIDLNGLSIPKNTTLVTLKYKVDKNTPSGTYPVTLRINSVTAHGSALEKTFTLKSDVIVKGTTDPTTAFFSSDEGVEGIDVFYTQSYIRPSETDVSSSSIRNPDTGEIIASGAEGQLNFQVKLKPGYIISNISVNPTDNYKQVKGPADTENTNTYRVTKVTGDIEVVITTKQASEYTVEFDKDSHVNSIDLYYTKDYTTVDEADVSEGYARDGDTGAIDISGDGQINFKVNLDPGYKVKSIKVTGSYKNIKEQENRIYRITKISGDLLISVKSEKRVVSTPEVSGYESSYTYTGSKIKPPVTVTIKGSTPEEDIVLVKDTDYNVIYGDNKDVGEGSGIITVESIDSSDYIFDPITVNFDITKYQLTESNVSVPSSVVYTGDPLTPDVSVSANGKTLVEGTDYDVTFTNQDGNVGENITATITGKGNFSGTVTKQITITDKYPQVIEFDVKEVTKVYGDDFTKTATLVEGDGTITYTSNNTQAALVDPNTGAITLVGTGQATIRAIASETDRYAQAITSYKLIVKKAPLSLDSVTINDKSYDGTKTATTSEIVFGGLVKGETLVEGTDYTVTGEFDTKEVGTNKEVTVTVDLSYDTIKRYTLEQNVYVGRANITNAVIREQDINLSQDTYVYNSTARKPEVSVVIGDLTLVEGRDYVVSYADNIEAGTAKVIVTGIGNYEGTPIEKPFTIIDKEITPTIEAIPNQIYTGSELTPKLKVTYKDKELVEGRDYTVTYTNNINVGEATVKISPVETSSYVFDDTKEEATSIFTIDPYEINIDDVELEYNVVKYDGIAKYPVVTVTHNGNVLTRNVDYVLSYSNNVNIGNAKVKVMGLPDNYDGDVELFFEIADKDGLKISGIPNNQKITYTENPVVLEGTLTVSENNDGITPDDLTITYYDDSDNEIERPTDVGKYKVIYSYDGPNYKGNLEVEFEIVKANSPLPPEVTANLVGTRGNNISTVTLETEGLTWDDDTMKISSGTTNYPATYIKNNDSNNYNPIKVNIPITGKSIIDINTSVEGTGGTISQSITDVYEGESRVVTITPYEGFEIDYVTVNSEDVNVVNNTLTLTAGTKDLNVVAHFKGIQYNLNVSAKNADLSESGIIAVDYNDSKTITVNSPFGYRLSSVTINDVEVIDDLTSNTLVLANVLSDAVVKVQAEKIAYQVIEGADQVYTVNKDTKGRFRINAGYDVFIPDGQVFVDEKLVDSSNYTSEDGSTIITFNKTFMDKLSVGAHSLHVVFNDGGVASCVFKVTKISKVIVNPTTNINNPITGDNIYKVITVLIISLVLLYAYKKKEAK